MANIKKAIQILKKCRDQNSVYKISKDLKIDYSATLKIIKEFKVMKLIFNKRNKNTKIIITDEGEEVLKAIEENPILEVFLSIQKRGFYKSEKKKIITKEVQKPIKKRKGY